MADNRDPGKDRGKDKDINTRIDAEEADDIFTKDPWTTDDAVLDDDNSSRRPTRLGRKWITEAIHGVAGGMAGALDEELERRADNLSVVKTELKDTWDDIKELREDLTKQLQPFTRSMENIARRILPRAKRAMPESWYKKMEGALQRRADERAAASGGGYSKEEEQSSTIRSELEAVFAEQQEHTLEVEHKKELDQKKERMIEQGLAATRHKADIRIYTRIYDAVRGTELFHRTLHTAYMKKSLEVQYKHFFVAQDTYNLLSQSFSAFEEYMRGVVKNTGLPDAAKANASDYLKELRTQKYGMLMSEYLTNARKMIFGKIKNVARDALGGVSMAASMAEMAPDMADAYLQEHGGMGGVGARVAGWILGRTKGSGLVRAGLDKIAPWVTALNGRAANFKDRLYLGIDKIQRKWSTDNNKFKRFIAQFLPNVSGITGAPNDLLRDPEKPAVYDKATRQTIVEIIPGYLRHILHEVMMFRTGKDDLPMLSYNHYRRTFTSQDLLRKDMMNDQGMADSPETQAYRVNSFITVIAKGAMSKNPNGPKDGGATSHAKTISKIMANHAVHNKALDPERLFEYLNNHKIDSYIEAIMMDIDPAEFDATVRVILNGITNKDGTINTMLANALGDTITEMRKADQFKVTMARNQEAFGMGEVMRSTAGEVYVDKKGVKRVFLNAQSGIIKAATGEIDKSGLSDRLADVDETKILNAEDISKTYGYEELEKHLNADEFVKNQVTAWKTSFEDSAPGKAMTWLAAKLGWFFDPNNDSKLPSLTRVLAGSAAVSMGKEKLSDTEKRIRKLAKASKVRGKEEEASSPAAIVNVVEAESKGTKPKVRGVRAATKRRKRTTQQEPEAVEAAATEEIVEEVVKNTPTSKETKDSGPTIISGIGINVELPSTESKSSKIKKWFDDNLKRLDDSLDKIPQTQEDVEKQVSSVVEFMDKAWKNRPKSAKDIQDKFENYIKHVSESHPELAKFALDRANELAQTRGYKFLVAWTKYLNDKIGKKATKWIKDGYTAVAKKASDAKTNLQNRMSELQRKASEIANNVIKTSGSKMDAGIAFTAINPFAKKEDREAARELIASEDPDLLKNLKSHFKKEAGDLYESFQKKFSSAMDATGGFIKDATKAAGGIWSQLKNKWREGTGVSGVEEAPERPSAAGTSSDLMSLLEEWRASQTRAHATLIDAAEHLISVIKHKNSGGRVTIKEFNRDGYGFFSGIGKAVGGAFKKTASAIGRGAWWLGKTVAKGYVHAAMLPFQVPYYAIKGVAKVGSWAANSVGINPFRDIYVVGETKPILTWRKQASKEGVYFEGTKTRPKSSKEIIEKGLPIVDHEGQYLITEEDIKKGLWAKDSSVAKGLGKVAGGIIKAPFSVAAAYIKMETEVVKGMFGIGKTIARGIFGAGAPEKYVDVYRQGEFKKPILTRRKQKEGVYLKDKDGNFSRLERSSDIHEPVYEMINGEPQEIVSEDDIEHGLCDVNGKPLGSGQYRGGLLGAALGLGAGIGKLGLKILGGGTGLFFSFWKNTFGLLGKAGGAIVSGVRKLGARLLGFDTKDGHGAVAVKSVTDRLDTIIELLKEFPKNAVKEAPKEKPAKKAVHGAAPAISSVAKLVKKEKTGGGTGYGGKSDGDGGSGLGSLGKWALGGVGTWIAGKLPGIRRVKNAIIHPVRTWKAFRANKAAKAILAENGLPERLIKTPQGYKNPRTGKFVSQEIGKKAEAAGRVIARDAKGVWRGADGRAITVKDLEKLGAKPTQKIWKEVSGGKSIDLPKGAKTPNAPVGGKPIGNFGKTMRVVGKGMTYLTIAIAGRQAARMSAEFKKNYDVILNKRRFCDVYRKGKIKDGPVLTEEDQRKNKYVLVTNWEKAAAANEDEREEPKWEILLRSSDIKHTLCKVEEASDGSTSLTMVLSEDDIKNGLVDVNGTPIDQVKLSELTKAQEGALNSSAHMTSAAEMLTGVVDSVVNLPKMTINKVFGTNFDTDFNLLDKITGATAEERAKFFADVSSINARNGIDISGKLNEFKVEKLGDWAESMEDASLRDLHNAEGFWGHVGRGAEVFGAYGLGTTMDVGQSAWNFGVSTVDAAASLAMAPFSAMALRARAEEEAKRAEAKYSNEKMKYDTYATSLFKNLGIRLPDEYYHKDTTYDESGSYYDIHGMHHRGTSVPRTAKGQVNYEKFMDTFGTGGNDIDTVYDAFEKAYKDKLPEGYSRETALRDAKVIPLFREFLLSHGAKEDLSLIVSETNISCPTYFRFDLGKGQYSIISVPEEVDFAKCKGPLYQELEKVPFDEIKMPNFKAVNSKDNDSKEIVRKFFYAYLSGFDTPRIFYVFHNQVEHPAYMINQLWDEWKIRGDGADYNLNHVSQKYRSAEILRNIVDSVEEYQENIGKRARKIKDKLEKQRKEEIKGVTEAMSIDKLDDKLKSKFQSEYEKTGSEEWYNSYLDWKLLPEAPTSITRNNALRNSAIQYLQSLPGHEQLTDDERNKLIDNYMNTYRKHEEDMYSRMKAEKDKAHNQELKAKGLLKEPGDPGYWDDWDDDLLEMMADTDNGTDPNSKGARAAWEKRKAKKAPVSQNPSASTPDNSKPTVPTKNQSYLELDMVHGEHSIKALVDGINKMNNLQNKYIDLLESTIGPNGMRVEGIPELTAVTATKPSGGNVTNITNVNADKTQDEGLDVRKSQK